MAEHEHGTTQLDGYRGIWFTLGQFDSQYGDKYSGGLGTYTAKHVPLALYAPEVDKTFFVYGGRSEGAAPHHLLAMVSYYDHRRGQVPRPTMVHRKTGVDDPHDNPSIALDGQGHIWVFVSGRGQRRPGFTYRSLQPYAIDGFERVDEMEFTYPQPHWIEGRGFIHLFTKYTGVRELYWNTSTDGHTWTPARKLAGMGGHYQTSCAQGGRIATAFNMHPLGNVDVRTNLYFVQSDDMGKTWRSAAGELLHPPLKDVHSPALVRDFMLERRLVYMKDITFDTKGRPVILVVTAAGHKPGPSGDPRRWTIVHWRDDHWACSEICSTSHNYDMGSLYIEDDGLWRLIAPTEPGPQPHGTGGEMALWLSRDAGQTWSKTKELTSASPRNHAYARRPLNAHADFYAFWADGDADAPSPSQLYFTNKSGDQVWRLPDHMEGEFAAPTPLP